MTTVSESRPIEDPKADDFMNDPWPFYRRLRAEAPVFRDPRYDIVFVTTYELVDAVLKQPALFSSTVDRASMRRGGLPPEVLEIRSKAVVPAPTLSQNDAPSHDVFKALVQPFFTPRQVEAALGDFIRDRTSELLAAIEPDQPTDVVEALAVPLPIAVIGRYLGLDQYGYGQLKRWSDAFADEIGMLTSDERAIEIARLTFACQEAMLETCAARREAPRDDIISHLVAARIQDDRVTSDRPLSDGELVSMLIQMLVAGNETTTNTLSGGIRRLALDAELAANLRSRPQQMSLFVEELLRLESPVQGQFRQALADTELGGVAIPKGTLLHVRLAAANRDEQIYGPDDDRPRLDRKPPAPHRAFGMGMHFCLGAMLSRLELNVAFSALLARFAHIELAVDPSELEWHTHFHLRGLKSLPVIFR